jgi:hypothetical protein
MLHTIQTLIKAVKNKDVKNTNLVLYKKTSVIFKRQYGIDLSDANEYVLRGDLICILSHGTVKHKGKVHEYAGYIPLIKCPGIIRYKFKMTK